MLWLSSAVTLRTPSQRLNAALPRNITKRSFEQCLRFNGCTLQRRGFTSLFRSSNITSSFLVRQRRPQWICLQQIDDHYSRSAHSSSNTRWVTRQKSDHFAKEAKVANLKSRAAFKLLQINDRYRIFQPGMTVVDLGFAPGSWSQVAIDLVRPGIGRVLGVDIIPVAPPKGVSAIQGDFLSRTTQERVRDLLQDEDKGKAKRPALIDPDVVEENSTGYLEQERAATKTENEDDGPQIGTVEGKCVDVVLSDMSAPWDMTDGLWKNTLSNPYHRMMNTSGNRFKDHAGSMDLCRSALYFAFDNLKIGGHLVCKFYQGSEDKQLEKQLKSLFHKVHREKPESSRSESKEAFFVGIKRLAKADQNAVFDEGS